MTKSFLSLIISAILLSAASPSLAGDGPTSAEMLKERVERLISNGSLIAPGEVFEAYKARGWLAAWTEEERVLPRAFELSEALGLSAKDGLDPALYHTDEIRRIIGLAGASAAGPEALTDLDVFLTDAFFGYCRHISSGRSDPRRLFEDWTIKGGERDVAGAFMSIVEGASVSRTIEVISPIHPGYLRLKEALKAYLEIEKNGSWGEVPDGPLLKKGVSGGRVDALRSRLIASGDFKGPVSEPSDAFDRPLYEAVLRFQKRHGLKTDGIVGPDTLKAMNVTVGERIRQIDLNMERWRWLPDVFDRSFILANVGSFELDLYEDGLRTLSMRIVVGKPGWDTPVMSAPMTHMVINPSWNIPNGILFEELLPLIRKDPDYLDENNIVPVRGNGDYAEQVDPRDIDWESVNEQNIDFMLVQWPGFQNPLGRIKFVFPNNKNIYLHDTPTAVLFEETSRAFSHSCIRIEKPVELAERLFKGSGWDRERILSAIEEGAEKTVRLPRPIDVHILYWTAWVDADGSVNFRDDIYGRDMALEKALYKRP